MDLLLESDLVRLNKTAYFLKNADSEGKRGWMLRSVADKFVPCFPYFFSHGFHPSCWDSSCAVCHYSVSVLPRR